MDLGHGVVYIVRTVTRVRLGVPPSRKTSEKNLLIVVSIADSADRVQFFQRAVQCTALRLSASAGGFPMNNSNIRIFE